MLLALQKYRTIIRIHPLEGHDIIGNHIVINEDVFSSEGLENMNVINVKVEPSYEVSPYNRS